MKICLTALILTIIISTNAQSLQRQTIASGGSYTLANGILIRQTIGQPYGTTSNYNNGVQFNPGFQQPLFSVETIKASIDIVVFPNPASNQITVKANKPIENVVIQIRDISGKLMINEKINEFSHYTVDCNNWADGTYMISLSQSNNVLCSSKVIINK